MITTHHTAIADFLHAAFGGREALVARAVSARRCQVAAFDNLAAIRELRTLTGDQTLDWCRGEAAYRRQIRSGWERAVQCRDAVAAAERALRQWDDERAAGGFVPVGLIAAE